MSTARDIKADANGDMTMSGGRFVWASDADAIQQSLSKRLQFFLGEWFIDESAGLPYYEKIFVKNPNLAQVREYFRARILGTVGVNNLLEFTSSFDSSARLFTVSCRVDSDFGALSASASVGA